MQPSQPAYRLATDAARTAVLVLAGLSVVACGSGMGAADLAAYRAGIEEWRQQRLESLKGPEGYLNLAGLYWIDEPQQTLGSSHDNDIVLPPSAAPRVGRLDVSETGVVITAEPGVDVRFAGIPVRALLMSDDTTDNPVTVTHGSLAWIIIKRNDRYALRLRDYEHPAVQSFPPLEYFPVDPAWRVEARLERFDEPRRLEVDTVIEGLGWQPESPGNLVFELGKETFELEAYAAGDELFLVFGDETSGRETYPAGRFLYAPMPDDDGMTVLDFNKAYNPPCAFNDFATCPVASPRNRLATRVEAGEKFDPAVHFTPASAH